MPITHINAGLFIVNSMYTAEGVMDKHSLWQRYVPLVRHEALRLQVRLPASVELDDLLQAGGIGLLNAVERYDALQGTAFTTYAVQRIRGAMLDELRSRDWVPRSVRRNAREVAQTLGQLEQELDAHEAMCKRVRHARANMLRWARRYRKRCERSEQKMEDTHVQ